MVADETRFINRAYERGMRESEYAYMFYAYSLVSTGSRKWLHGVDETNLTPEELKKLERPFHATKVVSYLCLIRVIYSMKRIVELS